MLSNDDPTHYNDGKKVNQGVKQGHGYYGHVEYKHSLKDIVRYLLLGGLGAFLMFVCAVFALAGQGGL